MRRLLFPILFLSVAAMLVGCSNDKFDTPTIPEDQRDLFPDLDNPEYVLINPPLDAANGYDFSAPRDVYVGADNLVYVCDTGNNRIVMMDVGGQIQGISGFIPNPVAVTQNDSLQLLVVNESNTIFRIDLVAAGHNLAAAPIDTVFRQASEPTRQFTGISVHGGFDYYVTVVDVADSSTNFREFSFIYDFNPDHTLKGPLPLNVNGTGLYSAILPNAIVTLREAYLDQNPTLERSPAFLFAQKGRTSLIDNNFPVQITTTEIREGDQIVVPAIGYTGSDIYNRDLYFNPTDITLDRSGFVFVVDEGHPGGVGDSTLLSPVFYRFSFTSGNVLQAFRGDGSNSDRVVFNRPGGIAALASEEDQIVYIADTGNDRVLLFQLNSEL